MATTYDTSRTSRPLTEEHTIDIRVRDIRQLFNSLDATPFPETDLNAEAEEFILEWAMEFPTNVPIRLVIHVDNPPADSEMMRQTVVAIQVFFSYRVDVLRRRFRLLMKRGRQRLLIGISFLSVSVLAAQLISQLGDGRLLEILRESLLIGGWVAMWGPLEILLYDWWPLRHERRICERLSEAEIEIVPNTAPVVPATIRSSA
jgi:hypothetical protein